MILKDSLATGFTFLHILKELGIRPEWTNIQWDRVIYLFTGENDGL